MCGIVGYVGRQDAAPILLAGLHRLEYRGYDSAGVAVVTRSGLKVHKAAGKIAQLEAALPKRLRGTVGIGHTRWATHGEPSDANAHPHVDCTGNIAVVHNGIIENAATLRARLEAEGHVFRSDTDTEVLAHLIEAAGGDLDPGGASRRRRDRRDLRHRRRRRAPSRSNRRGAQRQPGGDRHRAARDVRRLGRGGARAPHAAGRVPRRRRGRTIDADGYRTATLDDRPTQQEPVGGVVGSRSLRPRRAFRALHAQGDHRAAGGVRAHAEGPTRSAFQHRASRRSRSERARAARDPARQDPRLRLGVLRRAWRART